jgi:hypothetical protein
MAKKEKKVKVKKIKSTSSGYDGTLFSFIKIFFTESEIYNNLKQYDKGKNRFMLNRFMAINFPNMANRFNLNGTNAADVVDSWHIVAQRYTRVPGWIYTKIDKQTKVNNIKYDPNPEALKIYLNKYQISHRDFKDALKFNPNEVMAEIQHIEKQISVDE